MTTYPPNAFVATANAYVAYVKMLLRSRGSNEALLPFARMRMQSKVLVCIGAFSHVRLFSYYKSLGRQYRLLLLNPDVGQAFQLQHVVKTLKWDKAQVIRLKCRAADDSFEFNKLDGSEAPYKAPVISLQQHTSIGFDSATVCTLDEYCRQHELAPGHIEINLPGKELSLLGGCQQLLLKHYPRVVMTMAETTTGKKDMLAIFALLESLGYSGSFILDNISLPLSNFDFDVYQNPRSNFCCNTFVFECRQPNTRTH